MVAKALTIAHVLGAMDYGGVESMALRLIGGLPERNFSHVVINVGDQGGAREAEFLAVPGTELKHCPYRPGRRAAFILSCARVLREVRPARVLAYNFGNHAMVAIAARLARVPVTYVRVAGSPLRDRRTRWKSMVLAHLARPFCRGEVAVSESVRRELIQGLRLPAARVTTIPNGCDIQEIERRAVAARAARLGCNQPRLIMISRMDDAKDHASLLRAVDVLGKEGCRLELVLVGDGPRRQEHEELAARMGLSEAVKFFGNRADVPELLGRSDLLVHATLTEGFPNVLIEAMAAGVAIVATDIPACREILDQGRCGVLVPPRDFRGLARSIRNVLEDTSLRLQLAKAGAERAQALYNLRTTVHRYAKLLEGL